MGQQEDGLSEGGWVTQALGVPACFHMESRVGRGGSHCERPAECVWGAVFAPPPPCSPCKRPQDKAGAVGSSSDWSEHGKMCTPLLTGLVDAQPQRLPSFCLAPSSALCPSHISTLTSRPVSPPNTHLFKTQFPSPYPPGGPAARSTLTSFRTRVHTMPAVPATGTGPFPSPSPTPALLGSTT